MPSGLWHLTVRIQNNSYGEMDFTAINGNLQVAQLVPVRLHATFKRDIPALAGDVVELDVLPTAGDEQGAGGDRRQGQRRLAGLQRAGHAPRAKPEQEKTAARLRLQRQRLALAGTRHPRHLPLTSLIHALPPKDIAMTLYKAPLDDQRFALFDVLGAEAVLTGLEGGEGTHPRPARRRAGRGRQAVRAGARADQLRRATPKAATTTRPARR